MADDSRLDIAIADLDELTTVLAADIKGGGFRDNDSVLYLLKAWDKVATIVLGGNYHRRATGTWVMNRVPPRTAGKKSVELLRALEAYYSVLEKNHTRGGDFFNRADQAMTNFVWEYRQNIKGKREAEFVHQLQKWMALSEEQMMAEEVTAMDRSA